MADTRINALTTATASTSDDYVPIDGATNGTKKLSAFSPTFGGSPIINGTLTVANGVIGANTATIALRPNGVTSTTNQVTLNTGGFLTVPVLDVNNAMGCYGLASFYSGMDIEGGLDLYGGMTLQDGNFYAYGGITSEGLVTGEYLQTNNYLRFSELSPAPSAVANFALVYVDNADGDLKVKFSNGVTKTLATNS